MTPQLRTKTNEGSSTEELDLKGIRPMVSWKYTIPNNSISDDNKIRKLILMANQQKFTYQVVSKQCQRTGRQMISLLQFLHCCMNDHDNVS
jgi:hypothetical protein